MNLRFKIFPLAFPLILVNIFPQHYRALNDSLLSYSANRIKIHTEILSSDDFQGRGTGTVGGSFAAKYIASEFANYGLKPIGQDNSFYQNIPMHGSYPLKSSELKIYTYADEKALELNEDYLLYKSGQQTFTPVPLPLVFVGFGIYAPEFDYNDYQEIEVEGKIVVFLDGEPSSDDESYFNGEESTIYSYPASKQRIALSRGAAGSILIPCDDVVWSQRILDFTFENINLVYSATNNFSILLNPVSAETLFRKSLYSFTQVLKMKENRRLKSFPLNAKLSFKGKYIQRDFLGHNIVGMIEGNDPELKDSYLIISAHYDHLGIGPSVNGDSIYNGTLDNAIGVAVLLELAKKISETKASINRSVVFLALTGEEKGLLGSLYYTDNPLVPLYKTIANLNIDGIAFFRDFQSIIGVGAEFSTLENFLNLTASRFGLSVENIPPQFKAFEAFNRSDQVSFAFAGVPSILVLEGIQNKYKSKDEVLYSFIDYLVNRYHTPFDDLSQDIDYMAALRHAEVLFDLVISLLNSETEPEWKSSSPYINARLRSIAEGR